MTGRPNDESVTPSRLTSNRSRRKVAYRGDYHFYNLLRISSAAQSKTHHTSLVVHDKHERFYFFRFKVIASHFTNPNKSQVADYEGDKEFSSCSQSYFLF